MKPSCKCRERTARSTSAVFTCPRCMPAMGRRIRDAMSQQSLFQDVDDSRLIVYDDGTLPDRGVNPF